MIAVLGSHSFDSSDPHHPGWIPQASGSSHLVNLLHIQYPEGRLDPTILVISGRLDASRAVALRADIPVTVFQGDLILDLAEVWFMDSQGVALLISLRKSCLERGKRLVLCQIQEQPFRVLQICALDSLFSMYSSVTKALRFLDQNHVN